MDSSLVLRALLLVCAIQLASLNPIVEPRRPQYFAPTQPVASPNHLAEADEFMRSQSVTGEEIQEYNRMSGFNPPAGTSMAEERSVALPDMIKFWNWSMFDNFRQWVTGRRHRLTTTRPPVLAGSYDRQAYTVPNVLPFGF